MSKFSDVPLAPADPILGLSTAFKQDPRPHKINLGVGIFRDAEGQTPRLKAVKQAELFLAEHQEDKTYLPIEGEARYLESLGKLVFGDALWEQEKTRIAAFQAPGGTSALAIGAAFLKEEVTDEIAISKPTWPNHLGICKNADLKVYEYPYYDFITKSLHVKELYTTLSKLSPSSCVLLQASCHNPTGLDFSQEEWAELFDFLKQRDQLPFFDMAYQGLGKSLDDDAHFVRSFLQTGREMLVAVSNSKNFSLYTERVGALFVVCKSKEEKERVTSRIKQIVRVRYSNPPAHGARIVATVLSDEKMRVQFFEELKAMRTRIQRMRAEFADKLSELFPCPQVKNGLGMFGFLGLSKSQVELLIEREAIYMPSDGRINVCGLTTQNIPQVVQAISRIL